MRYIFITASYAKRKSKMYKRGQREETVLPARSCCCIRRSDLLQAGSKTTADLFLLCQQSCPCCSLTQEAPHQDSGATWRWGRSPCVHSSHLSLDTAYKRILVCIFAMKKRSESWCQRKICIAILM